MAANRASAEEKFLEELSRLSRRYRLVVTASGCCEGPIMVVPTSNGYYAADDNMYSFRWISTEQKLGSGYPSPKPKK